MQCEFSRADPWQTRRPPFQFEDPLQERIYQREIVNHLLSEEDNPSDATIPA